MKPLTSITTLLVLCGATALAAAQHYQFIKVDSFNANPLAGEAFLWDINDQGVACGVATMDNRIGSPGFVWSPAAGKFEVPVSNPTGVNNTGWVAGIGSLYNITSHEVVTLPTLPTTYFQPRMGDISDAGLAVGTISGCSCSDSGGLTNQPYLWDSVGGPRLSSNIVNSARGLHRINANNVALGWTGSYVANNAFIVDFNSGWSTLVSSLLPPENATGIVRARDINNGGDIIGTCAVPMPVGSTSFFYSATTGLHILPPPGGTMQPSVSAAGLNDSGQIVGSMFTEFASSLAFLYTIGEGYTNLNNPTVVAGIPAGYTLRSAQRISNTGWIVGNGTQGNKNTGWVLRPLPQTPPCDTIDFNNDALFPDDNDLIDFLAVLAGGTCPTGSCNDIDFNNDGLFPDDNDLLAFLRVLAGGSC